MADVNAFAQLPAQRGLPPIGREAASLLAGFDKALAKVLPLAAKHRRELPWAVADLSRALTCQRGDLPPDYMTRPREFAAYCYYFLPWNLYRMARLLPALRLDPPAGQIVDLGSGPLTVALAAWISLPAWRKVPLQWRCVDRSGHALKIGKGLLNALAPDSPWRFELVQGPAGNVGRGADLLIAANVINEMLQGVRERGRGRAFGGGGGEDEENETPADLLAERLSAGLSPTGKLLLVEPGTRMSAGNLVRLRAALLELGVAPLAPCPHTWSCPLSGRSGGWCHVTMDTAGAPDWLAELARRSRLAKQRAALSYLLATHVEELPARSGPKPAQESVRVVSEALALPGGRWGVYGCSADGLVLLTYQGVAPGPGSLVLVRRPVRPERDAKSGATIIPLEPASRPASRPAGPRPAVPSSAASRPATARPAKPDAKAGAKPAPKGGSKPTGKPAPKARTKPGGKVGGKPAGKPKAGARKPSGPGKGPKEGKGS